MRYECVRNRAVGVFAAAALLALGGAAMPADADVVKNQQPVWAADVFGGWVSTYIVVRVEPDMKGAFDGIVAKHGAKTGDHRVDAELARWNATAITPIFDVPFGRPDVAAEIGLDRYYKILVPEGTDTPKMAKALEALKFFENVANDTIGGAAELIPNDPEFHQQWNMYNTGQVTCAGAGGGPPDADIDATDAWDIFTGEDNVTLAVIDSGVFNHVDFEGHVDYTRAFNTVDNSNNVSDDCQHGTHVTGIAAAVGNNGVGVAGVSWGTIVIPVKVLTGCGGNTTDSAEGVTYGADHGANVETMSLRYFDGPQFFQDAITYAWTLGVEVIAAAGNEYPDHPYWPASFEHVLAVAATDNQDGHAYFSSQGDVVDIAAPGEDIWSTMVNNTFACYSGTSMATPTVAGAACLLWSYAPTATNEEIEAALIAGVEDKGAPGWDPLFGWGRLNVNNSLQLVNPGVSIKVPVIPANLQSPGSIISFDVTVKKGKDEFVPNSQLLHYRLGGGAYQTAPLVYQQGDTWLATLPEVSCGDNPEFYVSVEGVNTGVKTFPKNAPADVMAFAVGELHTDYLSVAGFNNGLPNGWSADGLWHVSDACSVGDSCDGGTFAYYGKDAGCTYKTKGQANSGTLSASLTVPDAPAPPFGKIELVYCSNLQTEGNGAYDAAKVFFNNTQLVQDKNSESWQTHVLDVTAYAGQPVTLKFNFDTVDGLNNNFRGWQVDGIQFAVTGVICGGGCYADYNGDGTLDIFDFLAFLNDFNAGGQKADCDGNGVFDLFDFLCFVNKFNAGC